MADPLDAYYRTVIALEDCQRYLQQTPCPATPALGRPR